MTNLHATAWRGVAAVPWGEGVEAGRRGGTTHPLCPLSAGPACKSCLADHRTINTHTCHNESTICLPIGKLIVRTVVATVVAAM